MPKINENRLKADLQSEKLARAYFLYGEESYLVRFFAEKIAALAVPEEARDMNLVKYSEAPKADELSDQLENMPFFSEHRCVLIRDLNAAAMPETELKAYIKLLGSLPETGVLIVAQENIVYDMKKLGVKTTRFIEALEAVGLSCEMKFLPQNKVAVRAQSEAAKAGCSLSFENADYLAWECSNSLTLLDNELAKLCAYRGSGEITSEDIESLVPKRIDSNVFNLARELFAGRTGSALRLLDALFVQRADPMSILGAMSSHFTALYHAKLGKLAGRSASETVKAFGYPPNRSFMIINVFGAVGSLSERYLGECLAVLYKTNRLLNSSSADRRLLIERAIIEIANLRR
ncbi:MAG: DNA polymerase III subunit delta [Ruminococcus sp.]|nr:DNA polymerase III subunit delta [Ruminococcus sp.]